MTDYPDPIESSEISPPENLDDHGVQGDLSAEPFADEPASLQADAAEDEPEAGATAGSPLPPTGSYEQQSQASQPGQPSPPYQVPVRRIYRSNHDRKVGGVSAGIAEYFRIDPTIVRLITLVFAITGIGIVVYLAAWLIVPERPYGLQNPAPVHPPTGERTVSFALGILALTVAVGIVTQSWSILALALIGGGIWLLSEHSAVPVVASAGAPPAPATRPPLAHYQPAPHNEPAASAGPALSNDFPAASVPYPAPAPAVADAQPRTRYPQRVTWVVLSLLALLTAIGLAASAGNWWDVSATRFLGSGVVIIGIGVVVGQLRGGGSRGGARFLIPLGILAALALFPVSAVDGLLDEGVGETFYRPVTIAELDNVYQHGIGQMIVDLSALDLDGQSESVDIDLGIGELIVIVPPSVGGTVVLDASAGELAYQRAGTRSFNYDDGINIETSRLTLAGDQGELDLQIHVGFGAAKLRIEDNS